MVQEMAMLHDIDRCSGCRACMVACKQWHNLGADFSTPFEGQFQSHADLGPKNLNLIKFNERIDKNGKFHWDIFKVQCRHCAHPLCMVACPEGAIWKEPTGAVVINKDKCVGCMYCRTACPYDVPRLDEETHKSTKCDMCFDRMREGMVPSCAKTCTAQALTFGPAGTVLVEAKARLARMKEKHPDACLYCADDKHVYGHMFYLLPEKPEVYGFQRINHTTAKAVTFWKDYARPAGQLIGGGAILGLAGLAVVRKLVKVHQEEVEKERNAKKGAEK